STKELFLISTKIILFVGIPVLYYLFDYPPNTLMDITWVISFAMLTKDVIMKIFLKRKYCDIDGDKKC
ncbi:MAG: hypothetical protein U9R27_05220, partial [Campylobacterota bacterium]|nr:hypothetical protein [Campylobacterota bacterium]